MAKISLSIPDELKDQLDTHAAELGLTRSETVARALTLYFRDQLNSPPTVDPTRLTELETGLTQVMTYLEDLYQSGTHKMPKPEWMEQRTQRSFLSRE